MKLNLRLPKTAIYFLSILLAAQILCTSTIAEMAPNTPLTSIEAEDAIFKDVLDKIAKDTGYRFLIAEELAKMPITVKFTDESLDRALWILLKGRNFAIVWDEIEKKISISIYGKSVTDWTPIPSPDLSLSGQGTKFDQATSTISGSPKVRPPSALESEPSISGEETEYEGTRSTISGSSHSRPQPGPDSDLSISGEKTEFDQASSSIEK
jgi:hypothetical protein